VAQEGQATGGQSEAFGSIAIENACDSTDFGKVIAAANRGECLAIAYAWKRAARATFIRGTHLGESLNNSWQSVTDESARPVLPHGLNQCFSVHTGQRIRFKFGAQSPGDGAAKFDFAKCNDKSTTSRIAAHQVRMHRV
tara:strand:- start:29 stop:445 length:417 start_codon:yes stop_codon:yes gene_type:complete